MILFILALALGLASNTGNLWVSVEPDVTLLLDGSYVGTSTIQDGGKRLRGLPEGVHELTLKKNDGAIMTVSVEVVANEERTIRISPLALRVRPATPSTLGTVSISSDLNPCTVTLGKKIFSKKERTLDIESVAPGKHSLSIRCGVDHAEGNIEVEAGKITQVSSDFKERRVAASIVARRSRQLKVDEGGSVIGSAAIPASWKRALNGSLFPGVRVLSIESQSPYSIAVTYAANDSWVIYDVAERLEQYPAVSGVTIYNGERKRIGGIEEIRCTLIVKFNGNS